MEKEYSCLITSYPETISMEQLYQICHISKRKARWLLENGMIPCVDSGKKTRRFTIRTVDVVEYLTAAEANPKPLPAGLFSSKRPGRRQKISLDGFADFLRAKWADVPDLLTEKEIQQLIGYHRQTIGQWICRGKLPAVRLPAGRAVAKQQFLLFLVDYTARHPGNLSEKHRLLVQEFLEPKGITCESTLLCAKTDDWRR